MSDSTLTAERRQSITKYSARAKRQPSDTANNPSDSEPDSSRDGPSESQTKKISRAQTARKSLTAMNPPDSTERLKSLKSTTPVPDDDSASGKSTSSTKKPVSKRTSALSGQKSAPLQKSPSPASSVRSAKSTGKPSSSNLKSNVASSIKRPTSPDASDSTRVRRSEAERIKYFEEDSNCGALEPNSAECKKCGKVVKLGNRQTYAVRPWETHRSRCDKKNGEDNEENESDPEEGTSTIAPSISSALSDVSKRKTEAERKMVLDTDPRAEEVKPTEVLCRKCQKWIKLSKSSSYALYNWISHQSRCSDPGEEPSPRVAAAERRMRVINDPMAGLIDANTVECQLCDTRIQLNEDYDLTKWEEHKATCPTTAKPQPAPLSSSSTEATLAIPETTPVAISKKRAREEDDSEVGEQDGETAERPAIRARTETYKPNGSLSLFGRLFAPVVKAFTQGFNESVSKED